MIRYQRTSYYYILGETAMFHERYGRAARINVGLNCVGNKAR